MQSLNNHIAKLDEILNKYNRLCQLLTYEEILEDKKLFLNYEKQKNILQPLANKYEEYKLNNKNIAELKDILNVCKEEEKSLFLQELNLLENREEKLKNETIKLLQKLNAVVQEIVVEINFLKEELSKKLSTILHDGYISFCKENSLDVKSRNEEEKLIIYISGFNAKELFTSEIGNHCVSSDNEKSNCQVFVFDKLNIDESFDEADLKITTCRSSGAGGQHINTTDSAIKVTHLKTNLSAVCQDERSQFQNKQKAIERLKEKVFNFYKKQKEQTYLTQKKEQLKQIKNNQFVKIYDLKQNKVLKNKTEFLLKDFLYGKEL